MKYLYRIFFTVFYTCLLPLNSYAIDVRLIPEEVIPGDVFLLKISDVNTASTKAEFNGERIDFYPDSGNQLIALVPVDINTPPGQYSIAITQDREIKEETLTVKAHTFKTIKLSLPEEKVTLSPENQKRAAHEAVLLKNIWPRRTDKTWNGNFVAPTDTEISEVFGVRRIMNEKKNSVHRGMDFRGKKGTPVKAINAGKVVLTDDLFFGGNTLILDHGMGLYSIYMHLSKFSVKKGDKVVTEQVIGQVGSTGRATGPHLHMSVKLRGVSVNPESLFKLGL